DIDCGGPDPACDRCPVASGCAAHADCDSRICEAGACRPPGACTASGFCWQYPTPSGAPLRGLGGVQGGTRFAVGDEGTLLAWNGLVWTPRQSPARGRL